VLVLGNLTCNAISLALHYNKPLINGSLCLLLLLGEIWGSLSCFHLWDNWQEVATAGPHFSITKTENLASISRSLKQKDIYICNNKGKKVPCTFETFCYTVPTHGDNETFIFICAICYSSKIASTSKLSKQTRRITIAAKKNYYNNPI
jgi:hypothetical protein